MNIDIHTHIQIYTHTYAQPCMQICTFTDIQTIRPILTFS